MKVMTRLLSLVICGALLTPGVARAQAPAPDLVRELLTEVRALRIAMERAATTGARIQLLVARVQLQEQRIAELSRRGTAIRDQISSLDSTLSSTASEIRRMESALDSGLITDRSQVERQVELMKPDLARGEKRRQDLLNEESLLAQQMAADQGRWTDVNNQLDELERALTPIKQ